MAVAISICAMCLSNYLIKLINSHVKTCIHSDIFIGCFPPFVTRISFFSIDIWISNSGILLLPLFTKPYYIKNNHVVKVLSLFFLVNHLFHSEWNVLILDSILHFERKTYTFYKHIDFESNSWKPRTIFINSTTIPGIHFYPGDDPFRLQ